MNGQRLKKIWGVPLVLGGCVFFGLLSSLLGTGLWYWLSWIALAIPVIVVVFKICAGRRKG